MPPRMRVLDRNCSIYDTKITGGTNYETAPESLRYRYNTILALDNSSGIPARKLTGHIGKDQERHGFPSEAKEEPQRDDERDRYVYCEHPPGGERDRSAPHIAERQVEEEDDEHQFAYGHRRYFTII